MSAMPGGRRRIVIVVAAVGLLCLGAALWLLAARSGTGAADPASLAPGSGEGPMSASQSLPGRWRPVSGDLAGVELTDEQLREMERLVSLGYVDGSVVAGERAGVTVYERGEAYGGPNLLTSGHAPEALLVDMEGRVLHQWGRDFRDVWPDRILPEGVKTHRFWRRAHVYANGDLLAIFEGLGIVKLDSESEVIWEYDGLCHHDLCVLGNGTIFVLEREPAIEPSIHSERPIFEDFITELTPEGEPVRRVSVLDALAHSDYSAMLERVSLDDPRFLGDILHTNTIEILDGSPSDVAPGFEQGHALLSILRLDTVGVIDLDRTEVTWAMTGPWHEQHQPTMLPNGNMLVFDNRTGSGSSRLLEIDPSTRDVRWSYEGSPDAPFYTATCGSAQRLPNGNTLVTESDRGRAFEIARDGKIVWEFLSPYRAGDAHELVATLFEVVRLDAGFPLNWAKKD